MLEPGLPPWDDGRVSARSLPGRTPLPQAVVDDIQACGYFPELVVDAVELACQGEEVRDHLIHHEATFEGDEIHRHLTVLVRTDTRVLISHTDDQTQLGRLQAVTSTESIPLHRIGTVALTRVVSNPATFGQPGAEPSVDVETWLQMGWGAIGRIELEPAGCEDPTCTADHGYTGTLSSDDITIRMSPAADGPGQVERLVGFATRLQAVTARPEFASR